MFKELPLNDEQYSRDYWQKMIKTLSKVGFDVGRVKGSHYFLIHADGCRTVVPVHGKETIGKGLFAQILRNCEINLDDFLKLL